MRAVVLREHGDIDRLVLESDFPDPAISDGDVLLRVRAASLNYHDVFTRRGMPGIKIPLPAILGLDVAGELVEVGPNVTGWKPGDRVLVDPINRVEGGLMGETVHGGLAELCRARAHQLIALPDDVAFADAASLPAAYGAAMRMMTTIGNVQAGEKVLVLGATGGVGVCCVQLAKLAGAEVIACTGSTEKANRLKHIGADRVINTGEKNFAKEIHALFGKPGRRGGDASNGVDVVVNFTGGDTWVNSLRCLRVGGRLLTCGATAGYNPMEDIRYIWTFELQIRGSNGYTRGDIVGAVDLVRQKRLIAQIDEILPLERAAEGMRRLEERGVFGKLVVAP